MGDWSAVVDPMGGAGTRRRMAVGGTPHRIDSRLRHRPQLDEYRSDFDKSRTVEKRRVVASQRFRSRPDPIHIGGNLRSVSDGTKSVCHDQVRKDAKTAPRAPGPSTMRLWEKGVNFPPAILKMGKANRRRAKFLPKKRKTITDCRT